MKYMSSKNTQAVAKKVVYVHVQPMLRRSQLHSDDRTVGGVYQIEVDETCPENGVANAALDAFHENNGIKVLEDFLISVKETEDQVSPEINQDESHENGDLIGYATCLNKL